MAYLLRDFTRIYDPMFFGSKVKEDSKDILNEVYKIFYDMGVSSNENDEIATYTFKDVC